jgi:hypothetical protein
VREHEASLEKQPEAEHEGNEVSQILGEALVSDDLGDEIGGADVDEVPGGERNQRLYIK